MLDLKFVRENPKLVEEAVKSRNGSLDLTEFLELDKKRREITQQVEALKKERNTASQEIGKLKKAGQDAAEQMAAVRALGDKIAADDKELKEILEINPEIKIMGSPWSCPKWMKGTVADPSKPYDSWTSGRLNPAYYDDYAEYFVQWVTEMEENGFPIYAITMQNEPLNKGNSMSLYMPWEDQLAFVKKLGPAFRKAGIDTKILCYDHNYNYDNVAGQQNYPLNIYADADAAQWVDGSAWHNYGGSVSELDNIRAAAPDKTIYFTEASIGTWNYNFESCVIDDFESIFLGTLSRYGKGVLLWNLMLDDKGAPNRPGGCTTCYGAIEISSSDYKTLKYNSHYYDLAQCAKVIRPGAVRIGASGYTASGLTYLAFRNPDGSKAFVALNRSAGEQTVAVYENADRSFKYTIPAKSIASFRWGAGAEN